MGRAPLARRLGRAPAQPRRAARHRGRVRIRVGGGGFGPRVRPRAQLADLHHELRRLALLQRAAEAHLQSQGAPRLSPLLAQPAREDASAAGGRAARDDAGGVVRGGGAGGGLDEHAAAQLFGRGQRAGKQALAPRQQQRRAEDGAQLQREHLLLLGGAVHLEREDHGVGRRHEARLLDGAQHFERIDRRGEREAMPHDRLAVRTVPVV
mmetsp:Transcript_447/g.1218  ORF Transcript_447/g.1218 Transcript_447/m.1218 type:complete len:209 (-) Transcript_447:186-812(-)